ncbi:MAG: peptide chain release factor N(5)-glutamine methyltransferase [Bacteroidaceae bacterium]|nr:peptide chain release factor N(5)-glutamine methyltransferase [Bacteroidaceae bacterium]
MNHRELIATLTPQVGAGEARAIVRLVMEERFGLSQTDLLLGKDNALSANDRTELEKIASRLLQGDPVQYVLGYEHFCGHRFRVTPDVLIPRPETEELVQWAVDTLPSEALFLDLCTGSGCIAISLALAFPEAHVVGVDISEAALDVARNNAEDLGTQNVEFLKHDILSSQPLHLGEPCAVIVSNPPYVRHSEAAAMSRIVLDHEPTIALFVPDADPLCFYRAIARIAHQVLRPKGMVMVEINSALGDETKQLFAQHGFEDVQLRCDQFNRPRFIRAAKA